MKMIDPAALNRANYFCMIAVIEHDLYQLIRHEMNPTNLIFTMSRRISVESYDRKRILFSKLEVNFFDDLFAFSFLLKRKIFICFFFLDFRFFYHFSFFFSFVLILFCWYTRKNKTLFSSIIHSTRLSLDRRKFQSHSTSDNKQTFARWFRYDGNENDSSKSNDFNGQCIRLWW